MTRARWTRKGVFGRDGALRGLVVDEELRPLEDVLVQVGHAGKGRPKLSSSKTAADGTFHLDRVPAGELYLLPTQPGRLDATLMLGPVAAGEEREGLLLQMTPNPALRGIVLDESGAPVAEAVVSCRALQSGAMVLEDQSTRPTVRSRGLTFPRAPTKFRRRTSSVNRNELANCSFTIRDPNP